MKNPDFPRNTSAGRFQRGFTLVEMLFVIVIIVTLMAMAFVGFSKAMKNAQRTGSITNLGTLVTAAHNWATDHGGKLPSPEYPGDYSSDKYPTKGTTPQESNPRDWDIGETGLWLDGVIYARVYIEDDDSAREDARLEDFAPASAGASRATAGRHLVETVFESPASVDSFHHDTNWYHHSFAMNANLQFDGLFAEVGGQNDAWLTEKTLGNLPFQSNAMLFIDCIQKNVVMAEDIELIKQAATRYGDSARNVVVAYLDGRVELIKVVSIPSDDIYSDLESSRFWRGVRED